MAIPISPESQIARKPTVSQSAPRRCSSERRTSQRWRPGAELNTWRPAIRVADGHSFSGGSAAVDRRPIVEQTLPRARPPQSAVGQSDLPRSTRLLSETHRARKFQALNPSLIGLTGVLIVLSR